MSIKMCEFSMYQVYIIRNIFLKITYKNIIKLRLNLLLTIKREASTIKSLIVAVK